ncbi:bacteriocin-like protein [Chryseobacterium paridis]|uniref:Bacteriocin n=1 Tax=Chryseobacterium paridis TaxID=2800328 RepID=A0ABS1FR27_9FLAO|nr:hypothetical protein [Chryseobacterium paridis]MBK1894893.1 hypothetical protein [Chryseobacterium paridis]
MKNLKKLSKSKLKTTFGGESHPFPGYCFYVCSNGLTYQELCRYEFICPEDPI